MKNKIPNKIIIPASDYLLLARIKSTKRVSAGGVLAGKSTKLRDSRFRAWLNRRLRRRRKLTRWHGRPSGSKNPRDSRSGECNELVGFIPTFFS